MQNNDFQSLLRHGSHWKNWWNFWNNLFINHNWDCAALASTLVLNDGIIESYHHFKLYDPDNRKDNIKIKDKVKIIEENAFIKLNCGKKCKIRIPHDKRVVISRNNLF